MESVGFSETSVPIYHSTSFHFSEDSNIYSKTRFDFATQDSRYEKVWNFATNRQQFLEAEAGRNPSGPTEGRDFRNCHGVLPAPSCRDFDLSAGSDSGNFVPKAMNNYQEHIYLSPSILSCLPFSSLLLLHSTVTVTPV
jgi:hypothetical protein